jgi:hypothetical protein
MQDVVRQLVGFGLVAGHVMNLKGSLRAATHGEMFHATSMHTHVWAMLTSALHLLYQFRLILPAVHSAYKLCPQCAVLYRPRC